MKPDKSKSYTLPMHSYSCFQIMDFACNCELVCTCNA